MILYIFQPTLLQGEENTRPLHSCLQAEILYASQSSSPPFLYTYVFQSASDRIECKNPVVGKPVFLRLFPCFFTTAPRNWTLVA